MLYVNRYLSGHSSNAYSDICCTEECGTCNGAMCEWCDESFEVLSFSDEDVFYTFDTEAEAQAKLAELEA